MQKSPGPGDVPPASELALLLVQLPGVPEKLVGAHTADDRGHCRGCTQPQGGTPRWPCTLCATAVQALRIGRVRRLPGR